MIQMQSYAQGGRQLRRSKEHVHQRSRRLQQQLREHRRRDRRSVKEALPNGGTVKKGDVVKARHRAHCEGVRRKTAPTSASTRTLAVIINDDKNPPRHARLFGPVARELRDKDYLKIAVLAPEAL